MNYISTLTFTALDDKIPQGERNVEATRAGTSLKQGLIDNAPIIYKFSGG